MALLSRREWLGAAAASAWAGRPPNILLIMCDQLGSHALGCYGGPFRTPNIDNLAEAGVRFTRAVCTTPLCSPARASFITGRYPHSHGIVSNVNRRDYPAIPAPSTEEGIKVADATTEKILNAAGYRSHHYGKWHLSDEDLPYYPEMYREHIEYAAEMRGFFEAVRHRPRDSWMNWYGWALPVTVAPAFRGAVAGLEEKWSKSPYAEFIRKAGRLELPLELVFDFRVAEKAAERIKSAAPGPWMITCSFNYPHDPNVVPSPYYESLRPERMPLPSNFGRLETRFSMDWSRRLVEDIGEAGLRELLRIYHASVRLVDDLVGRVLAALEQSGQAEQTIVVFTSDHGDMAGGHGMFWKSTSAFYEEIVRIPLIIRFPGKIKPGRLDIAASQADLMPTLLELVGSRIPSQVHGRSLAPYLLRSRSLDGAPGYNFCERVPATPGHRRKVQPGTAAGFMVLGEGWKYIRYADGEEFLYDLRKDSGETDNVAASRRHQGEKIYLRRELEAWLARTGYPMRRRAAGLSKNTGGMYRAGQAHTMCGRGAN